MTAVPNSRDSQQQFSRGPWRVNGAGFVLMSSFG